MNALLRKEIRQLLPAFLLGLTAALSVWLMPRANQAPNFFDGLRIALPYVFCPAMVVMLALDTFGREMNARTFPQLLAQPISRARIWRMKTSLLALATVLVWAVWLGSLWLLDQKAGAIFSSSDWREVVVASLLFAFAAYSGGLWTVLLFRQVAMAFWLTLLMPIAFAVAIGLWVDHHRLEHPLLQDTGPFNILGVVVFSLYGVAGFWFARRLFLRAQDVQWTGGAIVLPKLPELRWLGTGAGSSRRFRPLAAIFTREFQLHQSQLVIAASLAVLHLGAIAARNFRTVHHDDFVDFSLRHLWVLWLVMPLLVGCSAVAEERRLGTLEGQLCLPAKRRTQFGIKFLVVLLLSGLFGAVMPVLLERLDGTHILPDMTEVVQNVRLNPSLGLRELFLLIVLWLPAIGLVGSTLITGVISFFFSTLSRNALQAMGLSILGILAVCFCRLAGILPEEYVGYPLWRGLLGYLIGVPVVALTGLGLAAWNYRRIEPNRPVWSRNLLVMTAALMFVIGTTSALYHRVWELAGPLESEHGSARLTASPQVSLQSRYGSLAVTLPDGRVWLGHFGFSISSLRALLMSDWRLTELSGGSRFWEGTNWASVADCVLDTVGIQNDGSLWVSAKPLPREFYRVFYKTNEPSATKHYPPTRVGNGNDYKSVVAIFQNALVLKQDGTIWAWKTDGIRYNSTNKWPGLGKFASEQVGSDSDWADVYKLNDGVCLRKTDGRVWCYNSVISTESSDDLKLPEGQRLRRADFMDAHTWRAVVWTQSEKENTKGFVVGIREDGTFRVMAASPSVIQQPKAFRPYPMAENGLVKQDLQLGQETNWLTVVSDSGQSVTALKADGTLWRWHFADDPLTHPDSATATRLGTHSDWLAINSDTAGFKGLTADGSLWYWGAELSAQNYSAQISELGLPPLIRVSRRPKQMGNIFANSQ